MIPRARLLLIAVTCFLVGCLIFFVAGCAPVACHTRTVSVTWADGSTSLMPLEICWRRF